MYRHSTAFIYYHQNSVASFLNDKSLLVSSYLFRDTFHASSIANLIEVNEYRLLEVKELLISMRRLGLTRTVIYINFDSAHLLLFATRDIGHSYRVRRFILSPGRSNASP